VWLAESAVKKEGFNGFLEGLNLCKGMIEQFWDGLYPEIDEGDLGMRAAPMDYLGAKFVDSLKNVPLNRAGHGWYKFTEARMTVGYEKDKTSTEAKNARDKHISEGKLTPEEFDKSFNETPKVFYATAEKTLDECLAVIDALGPLCEEKFGDDAPTFSKLKQNVEEIRHSVHALLQKKRETEPDPVEAGSEEMAAAAAAGADGGGGGGGGFAAPGAGGGRVLTVMGPQEPPDRKQAIDQVAAAASFLRRREPQSPAPYLLMRGLRWGELRYAVEQGDPSLLEGPPTELRQSIKLLALEGRWQDVLEAGEAVMALPCSRGWLDLQKMTLDACAALGAEYDCIARAIRTELRALLRDVPQILDTTLLDDTPAANAATQAMLREIMDEPVEMTAPPSPGDGEGSANGDPVARPTAARRSTRNYVDAYQLARNAAAANQPQTAVGIMQREVDQQRSLRAKFLRRVQLVEICQKAGNDAVAQPIIEDMLATIDNYKLEEWEDRDMIASVLVALAKASTRIQQDESEKFRMFERLAMLSPARALEL
jgi:type VI secretion system protein ImpA